MYKAASDAVRQMYDNSSSSEDPSPALTVSSQRDALFVDGLSAGTT
jgi:hypothetical protein